MGWAIKKHRIAVLLSLSFWSYTALECRCVDLLKIKMKVDVRGDFENENYLLLNSRYMKILSKQTYAKK